MFNELIKIFKDFENSCFMEIYSEIPFWTIRTLEYCLIMFFQDLSNPEVIKAIKHLAFAW